MLQGLKRAGAEGPRPAVLSSAIFLAWLALAVASCTVYLVADDWACLERIMDHGMAWSFNMAVPGHLFYRPLTQDVYYRVMHAVFGLHYVAYHTVNMLLRGLNILLVIKIGRRLSGRIEAGLWAGLLFVANPGSFLNVNFITGIQEIAQMLLSLTAVLCFISLEKESGEPDPRRNTFIALGPAAYLVSLFCKESVVLAPVWLWIYDFARGLTARRSVRNIIRSRLKLHLPYDLAMLFYFGLRFSLMPLSTEGPYKVTFFSPHIFVNLEEIMRVASNAFGLPGFAALDSSYIYLALGILAILALFAWALRSRRFPLVASLGIGWFGVNIAIFLPVTGRFYPYYISYALIGLFWAAGYGLDLGLSRLSSSWPRRASAVFAIILAIVLGSSAWGYAREYRDNFIVKLARATRVIHQGIKAAHPKFPPHARIIIFSDYRVHEPSFFGLRALYDQPDLQVFLEYQAYNIVWKDQAYVFIPKPDFNYDGAYAFVYTKRDGFLEEPIAPDGSVPFAGKAPGS